MHVKLYTKLTVKNKALAPGIYSAIDSMLGDVIAEGDISLLALPSTYMVYLPSKTTIPYLLWLDSIPEDKELLSVETSIDALVEDKIKPWSNLVVNPVRANQVRVIRKTGKQTWEIY